MKHILAIIGLCFLGFALAFSQSGVGGKGGFGGKGGSGGGTTAGVATWALLHNTRNDACASASLATCAVTVTATTAGSGLIGCMVATNTHTLSSVSGGGSWVVDSGTAAVGATSGSIECAHVLSATGSVVTITSTIDSPEAGFYAFFVGEWSHTNTASLDTSNNSGGDIACSTTCLAPTMASFTGTNDLIVVFGSAQQSFVSISGSFTNPFDNTDGLVFAGAVTQSSYTRPTLTSSPGGNVVISVLALKQ